MNLIYSTISQPITALLAYQGNHAIVRLADKRAAVLTPETLTRFGINPNDGPATQPLCVRITEMRTTLDGKHACLRRENGQRLMVTGLFLEPVEILQVTDAMISEICTHVGQGLRLTEAMKTVVRFVRNGRNPQLRAFASRVEDAMAQGSSSPRIQNFGESLIGVYAA